ncbi:MAG: hypothetical protein OEY01_13080 [Desulfobulbaceae bacterium]|nr:hypothetical protein [Desulfobulbaceae bacterium]HIJ79663.1 hypothetical protein [Deltaproteobacteria bacterium]
MRKILVVFQWLSALIFLLCGSVPSVEAAPDKVENKLQFQYFAFPGTVVENFVGSIQMVMVNNGAAGEVVYDGANSDQVMISVPIGKGTDDLLVDGDGISCSAGNSLWNCEVSAASASEALLTFYPVGGAVPVAKGETLYFYLNNARINEAAGLALIGIDQQLAPFRAAKAVNTQMTLLKVTESVALFLENDPTVPANLKDGVDWREVGGIPAGFADGRDDGLTSESDPTVPANLKDGVDWREVGGIPAGFADGRDDGLTSESDPTVPANLKDGVDWSEISGIPAGLADGDQVGITSETDPKIGANTLNRIAKWNGKALVGSNSINESNDGNVGVGIASPQAKLHVQGNIIADNPTADNHVATKEYVDSVKGSSGASWRLVWEGIPRGHGGNIVNEWGAGEYFFLYGDFKTGAAHTAHLVLPTLDLPSSLHAVSSEGSQIVFIRENFYNNPKSLFSFALVNKNFRIHKIWRKGL